MHKSFALRAQTLIKLDGDGSMSATNSRLLTLFFPWIMIPVGAACILTIDHPVGAYFSGHKVDGIAADSLHAAEQFGTPYGQLLVLSGILAATRWQDRRPLRMFLGASAAGLAANLFKLFFSRTRPREFDFDAQGILEGFGDLLPLGHGGSAIQSIPSAHTACAFGFAAMLTWAYPNGRSMFILFGFLVGLQRVCVAAHFPSDVFLGATLGWFIASTFTMTYRGWNWFTEFEKRSQS